MRSQLHGVEQWVGPDTAQRLTAYSAHLRAIAAQSANRGAPAASSRPKRLVTAREDRGEDGLPTVEAAQVVEVVDLSVGDVPSSRSSGGGTGWLCRAGSALLRAAMYLETFKTFPDGSETWWRREDGVCARRHQVCGLLRARVIEHRYNGIPAISAAHLQKKEAPQR